MLQLIDRIRIPVVVLALNAVVDLPAEIELPYRHRLIGQAVAAKRLFADLADADPLAGATAYR